MANELDIRRRKRMFLRAARALRRQLDMYLKENAEAMLDALQLGAGLRLQIDVIVPVDIEMPKEEGELIHPPPLTIVR